MKYVVIKDSEFTNDLIYLQANKILNGANKENKKIPWFAPNFQGAAFFDSEREASKWLYLKLGGEPRIGLIESQHLPKKGKKQEREKIKLF